MSQGKLGDIDIPTEALTRPAVGLVETAGNGDSIARTTLRALRNDYHVLVFRSGSSRSGAVRLAEEIGATVLTEESPTSRSERPEAILRTAAKTYGFPGLILHRETDAYIDFEATREQFSGSKGYVISPRTSPTHANPTGSSVLAIIPAYNESATIGDVIEETLDHADSVLVVDDGSEDGTSTAAKSAGADVVEHDANYGYGAALKTAFRTARDRGADHLVILDGDGQHDPSDTDRLVEHQIETGAEIVIGSRFADDFSLEIPLYRRIGLAVVNVLTNLSVGAMSEDSRVRDTQSGFRVYDRKAIESLAADESIGDGMNASTDVFFHAHRRNYRIEEVGTTIDYDVANANTMHPLSHGLRLVNNILVRIERERPVTVLGVPGLTSILIGLGFGHWTLSNYLQTATFPLGLAIVATLFLLIGLFACFTSIILHSLNTSFRKAGDSARLRRP